MTDLPTPAAPPAPAYKSGRLMAWLVIVTALALLGYFAADQISNPSTNDVSVAAYTIGIAPRVSGPVSQKHFQDNQEVRKGDLLFEIDPSLYQAAYDQALARKNEAFDVVRGLEQQVKQAEADMAATRVSLQNENETLARYESLVASGAVARLTYQTQRNKVAGLQNTLAAAQAKRDQLQAQLSDSVESNPRAKEAAAQLRRAELDLKHTKIYAPENGFITNENLRPGTFVTAGHPVFALVAKDRWWVNARFKETQIRVMRPGDPVRIYLKMYPGRTFQGTVQGIGWGIYQSDGSTVDLLPKVDPTVDWVRLANRFVVRIDFREVDPAFPLRIGATGVVIVETGR
ncbi:MAG: HlyD family secretion protein [Verrucomicrobiae bacterium]|nr:HlyD family secretion protein [Verrucomicrobiae bacterium]